MKKNNYWPSSKDPVWLEEGFRINESVFCESFILSHQIVFCNGFFFTEDGRVTDEMPLRSTIYAELRDYASNNVARKVGCILDLLKLSAQVDDFPPVTNCIHLANGTLNLNGSFQEGKPEVVRNRLPVKYNPEAAQPTHWLRFLSDLLYPEDIPTVQEFIGYCLIPSNKGQRMMVIKGRGGEGKSQIGVVLSKLFGTNMKDGSIGKISENRFARADLEHILLCVDDDMRMEALRQTNYVKSIVTAQGQMDLERKGKQSYQGWMYARLLAFSNGDLQALYDRSDGFYRRQLVLTTRDKPADRVDDPDIAEKMAAEAEGIFLWAFEGLQRLVRNGFKFTESDRARQNRELVKARFVELTENSPCSLVRMGDIATYINGYAFKPNDWETEGNPIIRIQNLNDPSASYNYYNGELDSKYKVQNGDVLISWATHFEAYIWHGNDAWLNQHIFKVVFNKKQINKTYFVYSTEEALKQAFRNAHGFKPTMEHLKRSNFENDVVKLPNFTIQSEFEEFERNVQLTKLTVQKSLSKLIILKNSLMQEYFGG